MATARPQGLPDSYSGIWAALAGMNENIGSRQRLASILKVSTHTIQRILVDGDVPDIAGNASRRQSLAWARTLARLAAGLNMEPLPVLKDVGFEIDRDMKALVQFELHKLSNAESPEGSPVIALAEVFLNVLGSEDSSGAKPLIKALGRYIDINRRSSSLRASDEEISEGAYCHSCLAFIKDSDSDSREYCSWCGNEDGSLKPRSDVLEIMTDWFMSWQKGLDRSEARRRAESYMQAMPAWNS
jgi:hypothetical protein